MRGFFYGFTTTELKNEYPANAFSTSSSIVLRDRSAETPPQKYHSYERFCAHAQLLEKSVSGGLQYRILLCVCRAPNFRFRPEVTKYGILMILRLPFPFTSFRTPLKSLTRKIYSPPPPTWQLKRSYRTPWLL